MRTLKIRVKLILNCPRAHAITYTNQLSLLFRLTNFRDTTVLIIIKNTSSLRSSEIVLNAGLIHVNTQGGRAKKEWQS